LLTTRFVPQEVLSTYDAVTALNANFNNIAALLDKCVFRDGTAPNSMLANFDMNGFAIKNVGAPSDPNDLVRQSDLQELVAFNGNELSLLGSSAGASYLGFITSGSNAVLRTAQAKFRDFPSILDFDTPAHADAAGIALLFVPTNTTTTVANGLSLTSNYWGPGRLTTGDGNKRGKYFTNATAAPSSFGSHNSIETAFNGDLSKSHFQVESRITGATTLGQPTTGYTYTPELYPHYTYLYNNSGWNQGTATNVGRTASCAYRTKVYQAGQGDAVAYNFSAFIDPAAVKVGATSFLAMPAACGFNGDITCGAAGQYANPYETSIDLGGFDAAGVGYVVNIKRDTGDTVAGLGALTSGFRAQSTGTYPVDSMLSGSGSFKFGLDVTPVTFNNKGAVVLKQGDRIYGNASSSDGFKATTLGTDWIERSASGFWNIVYNNTSCLQVSDQKAVFLVPFQIPTVHTSSLPAASASNKGVEYFVDDANSTTRLSNLVGGGANFVKVFSNGINWIIQ
jgi:hypothetical protein